MDPLEYRVLLMLSSVYRLLGKVRLRHLEPWIGEWAVEELYAGVSGQGADDAAYATAVLIENTHLKGEHLSGGAADIFKCLDQIIRPLLYLIMDLAGMPLGIARL